MALTTIERELLVAARASIKAGKHVHLCFALTHVSHSSARFDGERDKAYSATYRLRRRYIMKSLAPYYTLDDWIAAKHPTRIPVTNAERRAARIQWIDWLLDEPVATPRKRPARVSGTIDTSII